ncbi:FAD binding domain-containing protein [Emcibacter nanhaiensis]|uniref:Xanthine dehydrogenase family protein subunit M n=1 Tax=Emcibacter nanhaiensis TaxID=1505037 RepID=A0A501PIV2_9PROT|nr:xanthine dehydrogenase family protein subunit M [Emcibacter nanhaiensis]TPD60145.1 xanthine dehydrogenase family protein subunit M [Emcibacter nanhaiensis]
MIPGSFEYLCPTSKGDALKMLADGGENTRPLAGGHSLIPMMKLRMASPEKLVDLSKISELKGISVGKKEITIGAMTTQHELIGDEDLHRACPIMREAALLIADPQVRYCGTLGGNIGNGDPGNDMPGLMQCLDATYVVESSGGSRNIKARDFYQGAYFTALDTGEIITGVKIPMPAENHGYAYTKLKRKVGDYATAAAAVIVEIAKGQVRAASIALTNVADTPLYAEDAVKAIVGTSLDATDIDKAVAAAEAITSPVSDGRGSAEYRTKMAGVMVRRALESAKDRAGEAKSGGILGWLKG